MKQGQYKYISSVYSYTQPISLLIQTNRSAVSTIYRPPPPRDAFHRALSVLLPFVFMPLVYSSFGDRNSQSTGLWRSSPREFLSSLCSQDCSPPSHKLIALKNIKKTATTRQREACKSVFLRQGKICRYRDLCVILHTQHLSPEYTYFILLFVQKYAKKTNHG